MDIQTTSTIPLDRTESPVLDNPNSNLKSSTSIYVWKIGRTFQISKLRKLLADTYIETRSYAMCIEAAKRDLKKVVSYSTVKRWLRRPGIEAYIAERMEDLGYFNGWTKERWFRVITEHMKANSEYELLKDRLKIGGMAVEELIMVKARMKELSKSRLANGDLYAMKLIGVFKGWEVSEGFNLNQQINITQEDGGF